MDPTGFCVGGNKQFAGLMSQSLEYVDFRRPGAVCLEKPEAGHNPRPFDSLALIQTRRKSRSCIWS